MRDAVDSRLAVPIVVSRSHVHLTAAVIAQLLGEKRRRRGEGDDFHTITLVGPTGHRLLGVPIVEPPRAVNQVEISRTDSQALDIRAPVRESGDLIGTPGILLEGPEGQVRLGTGVICAQRHLHVNLAEARRLGLHDRDRVEVGTNGLHRALVFKDVLVRVSADYRLELHLDLDEANAAGLRPGDRAWLEPRAPAHVEQPPT